MNPRRFSTRFSRFNLLLSALVAIASIVDTDAATFYQGVTPASVPWTGGIVPYEFDTNVTAQQRAVYLAGMREWELAANVTFVPHTNQSRYVLLRFYFQQGTNTYVEGTPPIMTIDSLSRRQIVHETGHLLGLQHEHVRSDRNSYISVNFGNICCGNEFLYDVDTNSTSHGVYDFESVMHYDRFLFAINPQVPVLSPLPPYASKYANRTGNLCLSPGDRAGAAHLYGPPSTPLTNVVTTTADSGFGSLRAAIYYANDNPGAIVQFNIPTNDPGYSNGVYTIYLTGELPPLVADGIIIDSTTQPGYAGTPIVVLDGSRLIPETYGASGLHLLEGNCTIRGLAINHMTFSGINLSYGDCSSNRVEACFIGIAPDGFTSATNGLQGVNLVGGAHHNVIGGTNLAARNVISGNAQYGVLMTGTGTVMNVVQGNYIGLGSNGSNSVPNQLSGVGIWGGAASNRVGAVAGIRNVISGNAQYGIFVGDPETVGTVFQGNFIGTDADGSHEVGNPLGGIGIFNGANNTLIGGTNSAARNVISGNGNAGIWLQGAGVSNNLVQGNLVGLNAAGDAALPNGWVGIYITAGAAGNRIGGPETGARNVFSGNVSQGIYIADPGTSNNVVQGNYLGTDVDGDSAVPNGFTGIGLWNGASANLVGGTIPGAGNVISGNGAQGVSLGDPGTANNQVQGNLVGTTATGTAALPNAGNGIFIVSGAAGNLIGGSPAARNVISGNATRGIWISDAATRANRIHGNYIGLAVNGTSPLGNTWEGVLIALGAHANVVGLDLAGGGAGNIIANNGFEAVAIYDSTTRSNVIRGNSTFSNGRLAINLSGGAENGAGITANDATDADTGPNALQNFPTISTALVAGGTTIIGGTLHSAPNRDFIIDLYHSTTGDPSGSGEGEVASGNTHVFTDDAGNAVFSMGVIGNQSGRLFTVTATDAATGDTSEYGPAITATNGPPPIAFGGPFTSGSTGFSFVLHSQTNLRYRIQTTTNLSLPGSWIDLTNLVPSQSPLLFTDAAATNTPARFYRAIIP